MTNHICHEEQLWPMCNFEGEIHIDVSHFGTQMYIGSTQLYLVWGVKYNYNRKVEVVFNVDMVL